MLVNSRTISLRQLVKTLHDKRTKPSSDVVRELGNSGEAHLEDVSLQVPDANGAREAFNEIFHPLSELNIGDSENSWVESFSIAAQQGNQQINVGALLGN
ncbi:hypothetical protein [Halococcus salsus]|uniref:hypothetical protein n=1 Tax=Halococcus salsus TaxID=2162894 RepID=UPI0013594F16|nr:hypothetical protein [Halococcus salsus]